MQGGAGPDIVGLDTHLFRSMGVLSGDHEVGAEIIFLGVHWLDAERERDYFVEIEATFDDHVSRPGFPHLPMRPEYVADMPRAAVRLPRAGPSGNAVAGVVLSRCSRGNETRP